MFFIFLIFVGQVGRIIGKGGANVRELQRLTGAVIKFPSAATENQQNNTSGGNANSSPPNSTENTSVHITGSFYSVQVCKKNVQLCKMHAKNSTV